MLTVPLALVVVLAHADVPAYRIRSRDAGITSFDLTVTETKRAPRTSILNVPGFHSRSAQGSRWLMCVYTDLASKRGFKYWAVVYPERPSEDLIVGFPTSEAENMSETLGPEFGSKNVLPPISVGKMNSLCGARR